MFNGGFYWESLAWESLWLACGRKGVVADFLKGLIKLAAGMLKLAPAFKDWRMSVLRIQVF